MFAGGVGQYPVEPGELHGRAGGSAERASALAAATAAAAAFGHPGQAATWRAASANTSSQAGWRGCSEGAATVMLDCVTAAGWGCRQLS